MPLQSKVQQAYLAIHHPDLLKQFAGETSESQMKDLPTKKRKKKLGKKR